VQSIPFRDNGRGCWEVELRGLVVDSERSGFHEPKEVKLEEFQLLLEVFCGVTETGVVKAAFISAEFTISRNRLCASGNSLLHSSRPDAVGS
jgi:hypothetical protein